MSYIRELIDQRFRFFDWPDPMSGLSNCCYFFDVKLGCKLIALFEAIISLIQIYRINYGETVASTFLSDGHATIQDMLSSPITHSKEVQVNSYFATALCFLTVLNSVVLFAGVQLECVYCLVIWICITTFTGTLNILTNMFGQIIFLDQLIILFAVALEVYFCLVVLSLIKKLLDKNSSASDAQVLYTANADV